MNIQTLVVLGVLALAQSQASDLVPREFWHLDAVADIAPTQNFNISDADLPERNLLFSLNDMRQKSSPAKSRERFPGEVAAINKIKANRYFRFSASEIINVSTATFPDSINIHLIVDNKSQWSQRGILMQELTKASEIFLQCKVTIVKALVMYVDLPEDTIRLFATNRRSSDPYYGRNDLYVGEAGLPQNLLTGLLLRNKLRYDEGRPTSMAYAFNVQSVEASESFSRSWRPLLNTFWVSDNFTSPFETPNTDASYSTIAHEMAHILGNMGHLRRCGGRETPVRNKYGDPSCAPQLNTNLMAGGNVRHSGALTSEQCQRIRSFR